MTDYEIVEEIKEQNEEYYEARDSIDFYFKVRSYYALSSNWSGIQKLVTIDDKKWTKEEFKKSFYRTQMIIDSYKKVENRQVEIDYDYYNYDEKIEYSEINEYLQRVEEEHQTEKERRIAEREARYKERHMYDDDEYDI